MEKRGIKIAGAVSLVIVLAAFGIYRWRASAGRQSEPSVETTSVVKGTVSPVLTVTGAVAADERRINASSSGRVEEIFVKEGDVVTEGQKLLRLDGTAAQRDVNIAWADLKSARTRLQDLQDKAASAAEIAAQEAAVAKASAQYQKADEARDQLTLTSPIAGTVISVAVAAGEQAGGQNGSGSSTNGQTASMGLMTIADLTKLHVEAAIDQADVSKVAVGQKAKITLDALPGREFKGEVSAVDAVPETNQNVVTYTATISVEEFDPGARLGMSADIDIDLGKKAGVLVVPNIAVRNNAGGRVVTKLIDGEETEVPVETGAADSQHTEITSGLSDGDKIVVQSFQSATGQTAGTGSFGGGFGGQRSSGQRGMMMLR